MKQFLFAALLLSGALPACDRAGAQAGDIGLRPATEAYTAQAAARAAPASPVQRCMNLGGALEARNEGDWGYRVRRDDLLRLKQAGFDTVRLPVKWSAHASTVPPYTIDAALFSRVDQILVWAEEIGLKVLLDVHHYNELMDAPDLHIPRLEAIWRQLAEHYEGASDSLIFELINEPHSKMTVARTDALNRSLLQIVRERHPDRWVVIGSANWGNLPELLQSDPPEDDRVLLTFHTYAPYDFTHQGASFLDNPPKRGARWGTRGDVEALVNAAERARAFRDARGQPMLVGEFGVYEDVPLEQRAKWTEAMRRAFEANGFGWCYWDYATTFKAYDMGREAWIPEMRDALLAE